MKITAILLAAALCAACAAKQTPYEKAMADPNIPYELKIELRRIQYGYGRALTTEQVLALPPSRRSIFCTGSGLGGGWVWMSCR